MKNPYNIILGGFLDNIRKTTDSWAECCNDGGSSREIEELSAGWSSGNLLYSIYSSLIRVVLSSASKTNIIIFSTAEVFSDTFISNDRKSIVEITVTKQTVLRKKKKKKGNDAKTGRNAVEDKQPVQSTNPFFSALSVVVYLFFF